MSHLRNWLFLIILITMLPAGLMEIATRSFAPQDLSGSWLMPGPFGQTLNKVSGTSRHQFGSRVVSYRFNKWHQRGAEPRPEGKRILFLGDSFTFGWLLAEKDTYVGRLQAKADAAFGKGVFQMLNGSAGGWSPADFILYLENFGDQIKPDLVLPVLAISNIHRAEELGILKLKNPTGYELTVLDQSGNRSAIKDFVRSFPGYQWLLENSHLVQLVRNGLLKLRLWSAHNYNETETTAAKRTSEGKEQADRKRRRFARALFLRLKAWGEERGIPLTILTTGWPYQYLKTHTYGWINEEVAATGVQFVDLTPRVSGTIGDDLAAYEIPDEHHPNERGAALIAEAAWEHLFPVLKTMVPPK